MKIKICKRCGNKFLSSKTKIYCIDCTDYKSRKTKAKIFEYFSITNYSKINPLHIMTRTEIEEKIKDDMIPDKTILERQDGNYFIYQDGKITSYSEKA